MKKYLRLNNAKKLGLTIQRIRGNRLKPLLGQPNFETHWSKIKREENINCFQAGWHCGYISSLHLCKGFFVVFKYNLNNMTTI